MTEDQPWPPLCVLLLTYNRFQYAKHALALFLQRAHYSGELSLHVADDGSPSGYTDRLLKAVAKEVPLPAQVTSTNSERGGYGKNYNLALQQIHHFAEIILPLEDDWDLQRELDLDPLVRALQEGIGCIRLGYLGWTQELRGKFIHAAGQTFLLLDKDSPEPHIAAGHPRLETREWERFIGPWSEDASLDPGTTEFEWCHRPQAREGVVWPVDLVHPRGDLFAHVGAVRARSNQHKVEATA